MSALLLSYQLCQTCRARPALIIWLHAPFQHQPDNDRIQIMPGSSQGHSLSQVPHSLSIATRGIPMANELLSPAKKPNPVHSIVGFTAGDRRHLSHTHGSGVIALPFKTASEHTDAKTSPGCWHCYGPLHDVYLALWHCPV